MKIRAVYLSLAALLAACAAPDVPASGITEDAASPPAAPGIPYNATRNAYFGDLHVHTSNSFDAYVFGVRATPDDAYRYAKGEKIHADAGYDIQLQGPPLDFLAVTDHGEYLGIVPAMNTEGTALSQTETAKIAFGENAQDAAKVFQQIGISFVTGQPIEEINDQGVMNTVWAKTVDAAERFNEPGKFTTFAAYEFTAMKVISADAGAAGNLHRNVIFKGGAPDQIYSTLQSTNPEDLWAWMQGQRDDGRDVLAIPHNSNASNGGMFALETYAGQPVDESWARTRLANEPLVEISQIKGTSETHPDYSPNDEWANFELYDQFIGSAMLATVNEGDYVRRALSRGISLEEEIGYNPYAFGFIGSSDTHVAAGNFSEEVYWGKFPQDGASPVARQSVLPEGYASWAEVPAAESRRLLSAPKYSASGLAGVWAESNTRDSLFDAMRRRETFGTSGPRISVRLFAGDYDPDVLEAPDLLEKAYAGGVPIGGDLVRAKGAGSPDFIAWAMRDPLSAPLQRLQIIKVWEEGGEAREAVFDVACSGGSMPDPATHRCPDNGASVDISTCKTEPGTGANDLKAHWSDPDWMPSRQAAYYVRVLENPTCRWSTWDAVRAGSPPNPALPTTLQERAWTSPIWVKS
ncbi:DUF3604 domain-containing protein [Hyphomonas sp.]|uniref:DUF3604 domain-containing protein n=1 Tax=Hyphomonas sp. TaxID=87 RepID=UPI0025BC3BF0|nr:DUF3604 domain-containing protein [Hyphomonas sp.]MBI1399145.1 DUF3604 domain-containing protein [Hyphomonas sp.]